MFHKLKLRLTLTNVAVMVLLILLTTTSIYFFMEKGLLNQTEQVMKLIATDVLNGDIDNLERYNQNLKYFFVKVDNHNNVLSTSSNMPIPPKQLFELIHKIQPQKQTGRLDWNDQTYRFLRVSTKNTNFSIFVFGSFEQEEGTLNFLLAILITVGLTCLLLSFFGSLYMAEKALIPIMDAWQRQKDFTADASHELRTPIAVIQTSLALIKEDPKERVENLAEWVENIDVETKLMAKLVEDLLFLSRADSQEQLFNMVYFPLHTAIKEAFSSFKPLAIKNNISFNLLLESKALLFGDETRIKQLVVILLDNAFKHTPAEGEISLAVSEFGNNIKITVSDSGEGIEEEHFGKIFERFYRVDKARSREEGGTGLGLSIADWIAKSHHGTIEVKSVPNKGTTFIISMPKFK